MIYWNQAVCGNREVGEIIPGMDAQTLRLWRETGRLERRRAPRGPDSLLRAVEIAQLMFEGGLCSMGLPQAVAHDVWKSAGMAVLGRRFDLQRDMELLPITLAIWRLEDGRWAVAPVGDDGKCDPAMYTMLKAAETAGQPIVQLRADALFDTVESLIVDHFPECGANRGPPALRIMRGAALLTSAIH